jgi:hypothetical protein
MLYCLAIKKKSFLNLAFIAILTIIAFKAIAQESIPTNINTSQSQDATLPSKPLPKNRTASPILKTANQNSSKSINTSITSPINPAPIKTNSNSTTTSSSTSTTTTTPTTSSSNPQPPLPSAIKENKNSSPVIASPPSLVIKNDNNKNNSTTPSPSPSVSALPANSPSQISKDQPKTQATENKNTTDKNNIADKPVISQDNKNLNQPQVTDKTDIVADKKPIKKIYKKPIKKVKKIKKPKIITIPKIIAPEAENKKFITENGRKISSDYFLQIIAKKSCDSLTNTECFRRDRKSEEPYFHRTVVSIFNNKIVAEQYFTTSNVNKKIFLKVNNGNYQLTTTNDNLISFTVQDGNVKDLNLFSGNISRETFTPSKCVLAEKNYGFFLAHNKQPKISETSYFANKNNFEGVRNLVIFSNIENIDNLTLQDLMAVEVKAYNDIVPIENLNLCKRAKSDILEVREISKAECRKRQECLILLNSNPDFQNKIIDESCLGYFDSKRQDYVSCAQQDDCNDFAVIKDCEVKLMAGD